MFRDDALYKLTTFTFFYSADLNAQVDLSAIGATENARNENSAPSKMQVVKIRDMKMGEIKIWEKCDFGLGEH